MDEFEDKMGPEPGRPVGLFTYTTTMLRMSVYWYGRYGNRRSPVTPFPLASLSLFIYFFIYLFIPLSSDPS